MNWSIYADNSLIYNPNIVDGNGELPYNVFEPKLSESTDSFGSLTYMCVPNTPAYDLSVELIPRIKLYNGSNLYWTGRIISVEPNIRNYRNVYVEDFLSVLLNSIYRPFSHDGTVADLFESIVESHNSQVDESCRFYAIDCDIDEEIIRSSEGYATCWSVIKDKLLKSIGGYIWVSYDAQERATIHYSLDARNVATQPIMLGANLSAFSVKNKFDKFYTACVPLGAKDKDTKQYVTIADVNDGLDYLIDELAAVRYGIIYAPTSETTWEDVTVPSNLLTKAQNWLQSQAGRGIQEIKISAIDASVYDINLAPYMWLDNVRVIANGFDEVMLLKSVTRKLDKPAELSISMGTSRSTVSGTTATRNADTIRRIETIEADYVTDERVADVTEQVLEESTIIEQKANEIIAEVVQKYLTIEEYNGKQEALISELSTQLTTMAGEISANFTSISSYESNTQNKFSKIESFIRILAQTQTVNGGLVLGESTSQIKAKLENDVLYFFSGDETLVNRQNAIAYFAAGKLYVNEVQINRLTVGQTGQLMYFTIIGEGDNRCLFLSGRLV